ncbi:MAG: hypothetical protein A3B68_07485 [Candidatus Melainabacteria bacterium RIFCSPHIGHO2_02_FULL_34_12]|nr:MAG: hypothetical protein A3B68_07485 [Candidatus Melainabacteria bacterium RIFCSPHIGHO2_02_FULL_34_12]
MSTIIKIDEIKQSLVASCRVLRRTKEPEYDHLVGPVCDEAQTICDEREKEQFNAPADFAQHLRNLYPKIREFQVWDFFSPPVEKRSEDIFDPGTWQEVIDFVAIVLLNATASINLLNQHHDTSGLQEQNCLADIEQWLRIAWAGRFRPGHPNVELDWDGTTEDAKAVLKKLNESCDKAPVQFTTSGQATCNVVTLRDENTPLWFCEQLHNIMIRNRRWEKDNEKYNLPFNELHEQGHSHLVRSYLIIFNAVMAAISEAKPVPAPDEAKPVPAPDEAKPVPAPDKD